MGDERHECHYSGFFDGVGQFPLVAGTSAVTLGRIDLALRIHKPPQEVSILVVNFVDLVLAKKTQLFFSLVQHEFGGG